MARWTDPNPHRPHPLAFAAGILIILGLALVAFAPFAGANNPPPPTPNQYEYWCGVNGVKLEPVSTPFVIPDPPPGLVWTLLVLKAGSGDGENETFNNPVVGDSYSRTDGKDISHVILCYGVATTTTATTLATTTIPTTIATTTTAQCPEEPCVPDTQVITTTTIATTTTAPTTTIATTTTAGTTTTSCPDCTPGTQVITTTAAPCLTCRQIDPTTTTTPTTVGTTTTAPTTVPPTTQALPVTSADDFATTAPAPLTTLPVTGGSPWWLALFGVCLCALGGLAVLWVRT